MNWSNLNWLDYGILGILAFSTAVSLMRGFIREAISLAVWIVAVWAGFHFSQRLGADYLYMVEPAGARAPLAFFAVLIVVLIIGAIINYMISRMVSGSGLSFIDRFFGMVFGFARGVLLVAVLLMAVQVSAFSKTWIEGSQLASYFDALSGWLKSFVPEEFDHVKGTVTGAGEPSLPPTASDNNITVPPALAPVPGASAQPNMPVQQPPMQQQPGVPPAQPFMQPMPAQPQQPQPPVQQPLPGEQQLLQPNPQSQPPVQQPPVQQIPTTPPPATETIKPIPPSTAPAPMQNVPPVPVPNTTPVTTVPPISPQTS